MRDGAADVELASGAIDSCQGRQGMPELAELALGIPEAAPI